MSDFTLRDDTIDVRDVIERFEVLETQRDAVEDSLDPPTQAGLAEALEAWDISEDGEEFKQLGDLLGDLEGNGGDEEWRGAWYPVTLMRESYFTDYAKQLAEDIGAIKEDAAWPFNCIDWDKAADQLKVDYTTTDIDGVDYYYR